MVIQNRAFYQPNMLFHMNGWSWLVLHNFLNLLKQANFGFSEPQAQH